MLGSTPQTPLYEVRTNSPDHKMTKLARNPFSDIGQMIICCMPGLLLDAELESSE